MSTEKNEDKSKNLHGVITLLLGVTIALSSFAAYQAYTANESIKDLKSDLSGLEVSINKNFSKKLSPEELSVAVSRSIKEMEAGKVKEQMERKFSNYKLASDLAPADKNIYGDLNARFTLVEFSDLECPYCKRFHDTAKEVVDNSAGNVNWQWKHLPLGFHNPVAKQQAIAAECVRDQVGNRAFWVFLDDIFQNTRLNGQGVPDLNAIISGVGADVDKVNQCMSEGSFEQKVESDIQLATSNGVNGTPATFVVDSYTGKSQLLGGAQPTEAIMSVIRKMIAEEKESKEANGQ
ncbi:DsbA family protein [Marinomonas algarum]|uniref:DsbA family protein n=1 Tax=Marinomonas algarum TaxID=2883105 RepID=A0A9X1IQG6_9GAMM|nr:DsbA family protein [Marinomonas algarum]MCB5162621.1 DsbA family protein [Marinomonas algarum]